MRRNDDSVFQAHTTEDTARSRGMGEPGIPGKDPENKMWTADVGYSCRKMGGGSSRL